MRFSSHDQLVDQASRESTFCKYIHICFESLTLFTVFFTVGYVAVWFMWMLPRRLKGHTPMELGKGRGWGIWFLPSSSIGACELV